MSRSYVNLNVNPCKMCMPLGGVLAFKGIESSMVILHGSQGCSTYIRRHMAAHYNEPVDIASSSLNEQGTVYGGADNLKKGIMNMAKLYSPKVIGVLTTCLAETIGEDTKRIIEELKKEEPWINNIEIVASPTPGYGGTQYEGYFTALRAIVAKVTTDSNKNVSSLNNKINVILPPLSPGDVRNIKEIIEAFTNDYILIPDISETLDGPFVKEYSRIPEGGTKLDLIAEMKNSKATIEISNPLSDNISPGVFLKEKYEIPLYQISIPTGIKNCDKFLEILSMLTEIKIPEKYLKERGRLLDAMVDAHKYNAEVRAIIYGEPHYCSALTDVALENGMKPLVVASGQIIEIKKEDKFFTIKDDPINNMELIKNQDKPLLIDDTDFDTIEKLAVSLKANMLIGNSDGRRIEEKQGVFLVREGFPIHDRLGGQRKRITGYNGTIEFIDETSNGVLAYTERTYREEMYNKYYVQEEKHMEENSFFDNETIKKKTLEHPCYNGCASNMARMHLPVAPKCNVSCNYCNRKYDCPNESRPGVTSEILSPEEALEKFKIVKEKVPNLKVVGIAGPGDALANFEATSKTLKLIRQADPDITFCLSTNGLMLPFYANEIIKLGVTHVTVTINSLEPEIVGKVYREINYLGQRYTGREGAEILINNQLSGLKYLTSHGIICKVNTVMVKGINDEKIPELVKELKKYGIYINNIMQMIPASGSVFENMPLVTQKELNDMRKSCEVDVKQMYHCRQCRADAIGTLSEDRSIEFRIKCDKSEGIAIDNKKNIEEDLVKIAIVSKSGLNIDQHFGHAEEVYIYVSGREGIKFLEKRSVEKYCTGKEECDDKEKVMEKVIEMLGDCTALIAMRIGDAPRKKLEDKGIKVYQMYDTISSAVQKVMSYKA
ncbi:nitrogenase cofactor biosynthesis protein NifB [Clostridium sp. 19966]|uniref:nitrogenase cofactor biosynthesis protein NifB n=1 Tax=Clostridium sp. 19966 TaxID=2768166 RepID=UPI0028DE6A39|nr:nitrogenase cofactor biosynthesis protein NifB [Clostridium sp. 19966]MDT8717427.1 nitrogenase cofactor biosynthesis protein NifB [Clostridium sp. 19966]